MGFFDDLVGGIGDVVGGIESVASDISHSAIGQTVLDLGGSIFGDPTLGQQVAGATGAFDSIFRKKGSPAKRANVGQALGLRTAASTRRSPIVARTLARQPPRRPVRLGGRTFMLTHQQFLQLRLTAARQKQQAVKLPAPPPPTIQSLGAPPAIRAILASPEVVADAVASGTPIQLPNGKVIDPAKPIFVPAGLAADVAATGLTVVSPPPPRDDTSPGARAHDDF